uniref:Secreted protein n=1 Tax=Ditylenchus dipsaci TaxID=166011 RepID=A0A915DLZ7_9BILA
MFLSELTVVLATVLFCSSGLLQVASAAAFLKRPSDAATSNSKDATVSDDSLPLLQESAYLPPQLAAYDMNSPQVVYRRELEDLADQPHSHYRKEHRHL